MSGGLAWDTLTFGGARRRRAMHRRLRELDRLDALLRASEATSRSTVAGGLHGGPSRGGPWRGGTSRDGPLRGRASVGGNPPVGTRPHGRLSKGTALRLSLVILALGGLLYVRQQPTAPSDGLRISLPGSFSNPPLANDVSTRRLLPELTGPTGDGGYVYLATQRFSQKPVTYDPCRPIHVVVNYENAPPNAQETVRRALTRVQAATGLYFILDGETTELASDSRHAVDVARYGNRWSPVLIAFTTPARIPELAGPVVGIGGSTPQSAGGHKTYVTGNVYLDGTDLFGTIGSRWGYSEMEAVILHELGHVVGLSHVDDPVQLMNATNGGLLGYGPGDLRGLAQLGRGDCERSF